MRAAREEQGFASKACGFAVTRCIGRAAVVLTTGTFLKALMHMGEAKTRGGRAGDQSAEALSDSLTGCGFRAGPLQDGHAMPAQWPHHRFRQAAKSSPAISSRSRSASATAAITQPQMDCHITYTNEAVHELIRANLHRAPMYSGQICGRGPRYCPSIEDKVVRFADKDRHQIFLEPEGRHTLEYYCNGISTSLPNDVQHQMLRLIPGLENAEVMRWGYAVEYDYAPPTQLHRDAGNQERRRACISPGKSTARQDTKKRPRRG